MKRNVFKFFATLALSLSVAAGYSQAKPTLEVDVDELPTNFGFGASTSPMTTILKNDAVNNGTFSTNSPEVNVTVFFRNQQYTGLNYGSTQAVDDGNGGWYSNFQTTGLVFGVSPLTATDGAVVPTGGGLLNRYDFMNSYYPGGNGGPKNNMYTTNPTASGAQLGTGMDGISGIAPNINGAFQGFTTAQVLYGSSTPANGRVYFGDLVIRFNKPVKNPVVHIAGLGGAYRYCRIGGNINLASDYKSTFFSTEFELDNVGLTSQKLSGNQFFDIQGNNIVNLNDSTPNGASFNAGLEGNVFNNYGAATGSVKLVGTVQEIVYRVYLQGGNNSEFAWSVHRDSVINNNRSPFTGDVWYAAVSLEKPTQQISGNVFIDRDGLTDNNINQSLGIANPKTNVGGLLYANLLNASGSTVIATVPVSSDGTYLFDSVATGSYRVQLTTNQGTPGQPTPVTALPSGWVNTGENGSNTPGDGTGSDGNVNSISANIPVNASDIKTEVNFGIERTPVSVPFSYIIAKPTGGITLTLFGGVNNFAPLTGSDPEDQPATGTLSGKTVQITELPAAFSILRYNGVDVVAGQVIPNYNPALLQIAFIGSTPVSFAEFKYSYIDAAGKPSVPTIYRLEWFGGPLAITITNFAAIKNNCTADLTWTTASEINASRFEVEVSTSNSAVYNKVGSVNATATNGNGKTYQFSYPMQPGVQYYFRLKLMDKDGSFKYSDVRTLSCEGKGVITIAPNPVVDRFSISGMENGKNTIVIYSANGQQVKTQVIPQNQGYVYIQNLASGVYNVKVISEKGNTTVAKLVKQ